MAAPRFDRLDALRGLAVVWMVGFHAAFDLDHFGFIDEDFRRDPLWTGQRIVIVSLFLFSVGLGQALALDAGQPTRRFWRRWLQIAGCAALVSVGSWLMFPHSWIFFGVLHAVAVMLPIVRLTAGWGAWLWVGGAVAIALPQLLASNLFDGEALRWLGLARRKPVTEDFVPLLPWIGVVWWGLASGQLLLRRVPQVLRGAMPRSAQALAAIGRRSLAIYMLHQPLLIGLIGLVAWHLGRLSG